MWTKSEHFDRYITKIRVRIETADQQVITGCNNNTFKQALWEEVQNWG